MNTLLKWQLNARHTPLNILFIGITPVFQSTLNPNQKTQFSLYLGTFCRGKQQKANRSDI